MPPPPPPPPSRRPTDHKAASAASKEENIYIPSFISKRPFYAVEDGAAGAGSGAAGEGAPSSTADYLEHQRLQRGRRDELGDPGTKWYDRGRKLGPAATKYRKGACENCGAMTHKAKECLSRPRAKGARWTGRDIQADELVQDVNLGWDAKRDRWNGYDPREYRRVVERYNQMEELRGQVAASDGDDAAAVAAAGAGAVEPVVDEDGSGGGGLNAGEKYAEESDMGRHQSTATRQLRLREDTAKYLLNLDLESAKYDPKTRTMVDAGATADDRAARLFAEEGFLRASGDAAAFESAQRYAWEKQERSGDTSQHLQANPTAGEYFRKKEREEAEREREARRRALEDKYGASASGNDSGGSNNKEMPEALRQMQVTESEAFHEYDEAGLIKGAPRRAARSRYPEDVLVNNHTAVWGSWWSDFRWGYACCHSLVRKSYCTGEEGRRAWEAAERQRTGVSLEPEPEVEAGRDVDGNENGEGEREREPLKSAAAAAAAKKRTAEEMMGGVTEAEMDEYRRKKTAADDPMAKFLGKDELVR